jgi:hypothetical protein
MKKKKRILTKAERERILKNLNATPNNQTQLAQPPLSQSTTTAPSPHQSATNSISIDDTTYLELRKIFIQLGAILGLLIIIAWTNHTYHYLDKLGQILASHLGL